MKKRYILFIIVAFLFLIILFGTSQFEPSDGPVKKPVVKKPTITPGLSGARDLSGTWIGNPIFTERSPVCSYGSDMVLNLQQNGNNVNGNFNVVVKSAKGTGCLRVGTAIPGYPVAGTLTSSAIDMKISGVDTLKGSFTTDTMTLRWEQCKNCDSGPAIKFVGSIQLKRK